MGLLLVTFLSYMAAAGPVVRGEPTPQTPSLMPSCMFSVSTPLGGKGGIVMSTARGQTGRIYNACGH